VEHRCPTYRPELCGRKIVEIAGRVALIHEQRTADIAVTSVLQTTAGKMIFGRLWEEKHAEDNSNSQTAIHDSRSLGFRRATRELRQTTIIEEVEHS